MQPYGSVGPGCRNSVITLLEVRFKGFDRAAHNHAQIHALALQTQAATGNPCHIQQTGGELCHLAHLPFDQCVHPELQGEIFVSPTPQYDDRILDRRERAAQLMAEHREELILTAICGDKLLDSRPSESPWPAVPRDERLRLYEAAGRCVPDDNIPVVYGQLSVERIAGGEWP